MVFGTVAPTPAAVLAADPVARTVLVGVGGNASLILGTFDQVATPKQRATITILRSLCLNVPCDSPISPAVATVSLPSPFYANCDREDVSTEPKRQS